jgi:putative DNA methylase
MSDRVKRKLIEVALPLEAINREAAREKSIRYGHPSTLHLWWARRPLAACRAVLFASIVDDPSSKPEVFATEAEQEVERRRLFEIIERLVKWENSDNQDVLAEARAEIQAATGGNPPSVIDPFCGGGSIPLEAQRLGLEAFASDLNPVAVLITRALIEVPSQFAGKPPINPDGRAGIGHDSTWIGARGLADDVRYYGKWIHDRALERIGHLYPKADLPGGGTATVIAWIWARTIKCPNPACGAEMPLVRSFRLASKKGKEAHIAPVVDQEAHLIRFSVESGLGPVDGTVGRRGATCAACGASVPLDYVRQEAQRGRMSARLMAIAAEGVRSRVYLPATDMQEQLALAAQSHDSPASELPARALGFRVQAYGMTHHRDLFTARQLAALCTFVELVGEARDEVRADGGSETYADAVATYLAFGVSRSADYWSTICTWHSGVKMESLRNTFARHAIPMTWDYAEGNPFSSSTGNWIKNLQWPAAVLDHLSPGARGHVVQLDATELMSDATPAIVSTDPPYYDNIGYADLSDFFYVWLRKALGSIDPDLFSTLLTPKARELVATPFRFGGDARKADAFFEQGLNASFVRLGELQDADYPMTVYYAFKQTETDGANEGSTSTGWETMLKGLLDSGFAVTGTWPVRSEMSNRAVAAGTNALASSIVLVCRKRAVDAAITTRRDFVTRLRAELPESLRTLRHGNIAPVDFAQAAIGPGMAAFSRFAKVIEADGSAMGVRTALSLINRTLDEILAEQEGDFDAYTRFAVAWFGQRGFSDGPYGEAETLATAKAISVEGVERAGILSARAGVARLLRRDELGSDWNPATDDRPTVWEATHYLVDRLDQGGESRAAELLRLLGGYSEPARDLAYLLFSIAERRGWTNEAVGYNALVVAWPEIARLAAERSAGPEQQTLGV